ncbi:hypothetical protein [Paenibacillus sp. P13VS]|uniref:hypothetical protein n=1 Tax=Paenibacillus sp. P13VS TaxID=2697367 RepID=UPI00187B10CC|nr:hypothetical protein [Paenibacillus sp. P13VS]MBE7680146.1 hypothetical protein [Paenibacillus sp. P13VS]
MGGAADVEVIVLIEVMVDLREEATECAYPADKVKWLKVPLDDDTKEHEAELFKKAIDKDQFKKELLNKIFWNKACNRYAHGKR